MFKKLREIAGAIKKVVKNEDLPPEQRPKSKKRKAQEKQAKDLFLSKLAKEKEIATAKEEPWVALVSMDVDYEDLNNGSFELDWNDKFITNLIRFGYQGKTDADLVDQWFTDVCRNVVLETFEQAQADIHPVRSRDLGDGKREYK